MGKCASKCCFCVPGLHHGGGGGKKGKGDAPIQFTITATPQRNESSKEDPDFVPPTPQTNSGFQEDEGGKGSTSGSSCSDEEDEGLFGRRQGFDCKSLDEISLSKEMDNRSKEIMQSYQLREQGSGGGGTFFRPPSSSEDSCLPESIPSTHPLPKEDSESVISSESYEQDGSRRNMGFIGDDNFLIGSYHYKTEVIGEVKSVYSRSSRSSSSSEEEEKKEKQVTTANLTLIDRCMGLELNENDDVCEMSSVRFVLGDSISPSEPSSPGSIDSSSLDAVFPLSLTKATLEISDEVQTRL